MAQWRERFLVTILGFAFVCGALAAVPSIIAAAHDRLWSVIVVDAVALLGAFVLWRRRDWPYRVRALSLVLLIYLLGAWFLVRVGPVSQIYLMAFPVMVSILLGLRPALMALLLNALTLMGVGFLADGDLQVPGLSDMPALKWAVITVNFTFVDTMITVATAILLQRLETALERQRAATLTLQGEQVRLKTAYKALMHESIERQRAEAAVHELNAGLEQRVRERTVQLEAANRELAAFSYTVSHDLRAPLTAINGFGAQLEKALGDSADGPTRHSLERIQANSRHMGELIDALLALARLSRAELQWDRVDLGAMAREVLDALAEREPARQVRCVVAPDVIAFGDRNLLQVVLDNLLGNAWKFTARRADASIELGRSRSPAGETCYFVKDNGAGFDMAHAARLFGTFQRLHAPEEFPGTGVGLVTVQRIVSRHGGRVWAEAVVGEGATFYFTLSPGGGPQG